MSGNELSPRELLAQVGHRPIKLPDKPWKYAQQWRDVLMLHFAVDSQVLQPWIPKGLALDLADEKAYLSMFAFKVENNRMRAMPSIPWVSDFLEINLRTYVRSGEKQGIYFLSIEASKRPTVWLAKYLIGLPYEKADISRKEGRYRSSNPDRTRALDVVFDTGETIGSKSGMDVWLTERYCVFTPHAGELYEHNVHHLPWLLQKVVVADCELKYPLLGLAENRAPVAMHYSPGVDVLLWGRANAGRKAFE